jgi:hypothetical protein
MKSNASRRRRRLFDHLLQDLGYDPNLVVVQLDGFRKLGELLHEFAGRRHEASHANKRAHDFNFTRTAVGDRNTLESIATPCSVKTQGSFRRPPRPTFDIAICDIKAVNSCCVS